MHHFLGHIKIKVHIGALDEYSQYCIIVYTMFHLPTPLVCDEFKVDGILLGWLFFSCV